MTKNVITIALNKSLYVDFAINLANSFILWNDKTEIDFYLFTDLPDLVPQSLQKRIHVVSVNKGELKDGFSSKLFLDLIVPAGQTLFIDSDCLIFRPLDDIFEKFKGKPVSVVGSYISTGEWFGNIYEICTKFALKQMPKFNGGIYYLEKGDEANKVYSLARALEKSYDEIGFVRLRGKPNDEVLMSLAMAINNLAPVADDGTIMGDPYAYPAPYRIDIKSGKTRMINPRFPSGLNRSWNSLHQISPLIIHFLGDHTNDYQYKREVTKLSLLMKNEFNFIRAAVLYLRFDLKHQFIIRSKNLLRPVYRSLFGTRTIETSERI